MPDSFTVLRCTECGATRDGRGWSRGPSASCKLEPKQAVFLDDVVEAVREEYPEDYDPHHNVADFIERTFGDKPETQGGRQR